MARRQRLHIPGAFYHVTLRGNHRQPIFFRDEDHDLLDRLVATSIERVAARVHAYCWMPNHLHMLVQVSDVPLGALMLRIASGYARTVQLRLETTGHLFERRYHAELVEDDRYLLTVVRYIHLNPVNAKIVKDARDYIWSSHRAYLGDFPDRWLTTAFVLNILASRRDAALNAYRQLAADPGPGNSGPGDDRRVHTVGSPADEDDDTIARMLDGLPAKPPRPSLESLAQACCERFEVTMALLASRSRAQPLQKARAWLAHEARRREVASISTVARLLGRCEGALRHIMRRYGPVAVAS